MEGLPISPRCPDWCLGHDSSWDVRPAATTKTCRRPAQVETGDERAEVELERFVEMVDGKLVTHPPTVRVLADEAFSLEFAAHLADVVGRMVEIAQCNAGAA